MALSSLTAADIPVGLPSAGDQRVFPSSIQTDWFTICTAPDAIDDSASGAIAGGKVVRPDLIDRAAQTVISPGPSGTHLLIALKYNTDAGTLTDPVVRCFGCDRNGLWYNLVDGSNNIELTIATAPTTDPLSGDTYKLTKPIIVDMRGAFQVIVAVQTAFAAVTGTVADSELLGKIINSR